MAQFTVTARAHPNIAFIKYWGNQDEALRIPMNSSISMNLAALFTTIEVEFRPDLQQDELIVNGKEAEPPALKRVSEFLDILRTCLPEKIGKY